MRYVCLVANRTVRVLWKVADLVVLAFGHLAQALFFSNALFDDVWDWRYYVKTGNCGNIYHAPLGLGTGRFTASAGVRGTPLGRST